MDFSNFVNEQAKNLVGNWRKFSDFGWNYDDEITDIHNWCIVYTVNRDSDLLTQSNAEEIKKRLEPYLEEDIREEHHGHWGCGWVDGYSIRVIQKNWKDNKEKIKYTPTNLEKIKMEEEKVKNKYTPAFLEWCKIQLQLEDYPILDEEDFYLREYNDTLSNIEIEGKQIIKNPHDNWSQDVYEWLSNNKPSSIESRDGFGGYPNDEQIAEALYELENLDENFISLVED